MEIIFFTCNNKIMLDKITIKGAKEHNLKDVSLEIQKRTDSFLLEFPAQAKSSLAFDTIFAEGQRRYIESLSTYARQFFWGRWISRM